MSLPTGPAVTLQEMLHGRTWSACEEERILEPLYATDPVRLAVRVAELLGDKKPRSTAAHYTPRWLAEQVTQRTLEPLFLAMQERGTPSSEQILNLKVCDPAIGSGAFLVAGCRFLADQLVAAWEREGKLAQDDAVVRARRLVAQRCIYGVDRNPFAVSLSKLALWMLTLAKEQPFAFLEHALRCGDSLVGLSQEELRSVGTGGVA